MGSGTLTERLCNWLIAILNEKGAGLPEFSAETKYNVQRGRDNPESYYYCVDNAYVSVIEQLLVSITASNRYKSDVAILWNCVSAVLCEINSSPMENTVANLFANLIDLLRYIRHFNSSITSWVGFTFPKDKVNDTNNYACRLEVVWKECKFVCNVASLKKEDIKKAVQDTFANQIKLVKRLQIQVSSTEHFLVPLSENDLEFISGKLDTNYDGTTTLTQVKSKFSILLTNGNYYFKFPGNMSHQRALDHLIIESLLDMDQLQREECAKHLVLPIKILRLPLPFVVFPAMKYQLTKDVAMQCLPHLADGIREGLDKLHGLGLAHLDVRLPNVCVGDDYEVKLIDFDRSSHSNDVKKYGGQFMYKYETKQMIVQHLDWKQFGLLLFTLSSYRGPKHQNELTKDDIPQGSSPFLKKLIFRHTCNDKLLHKWKESLQPSQKRPMRPLLQ